MADPDSKSTSLNRLRAELADRYLISSRIGAGASATVYLADDLKHHRAVALKVLHPDLTGVLGPERFLREIEVTSNLAHPHIMPLLDSGAAAGHLYLVMPYIEGESLRARLKRERQLPLEDVVRLTEEVAEALDHAHRHDIVHRDLKPDNVLLVDDHAVLADFGIARAMHRAGGDAVTTTGVVVGTPAYMSPEQAGKAELDGRSDQYSLACMTYEMLAGEPPFTAPTVESVVYQHLVADPPTVSQRRRGVPAPVGQVLRRALSKAPAERYGTIKEFAERLSEASRGQPTPWPTRLLDWAGGRGLSRGVRNTRVALWVALLGVTGAATWFVCKPPIPMTQAEVFYKRGVHYLREEAETRESAGDAIEMFHRSLEADSGLARAWAGLGEAYWTRYEHTREPSSMVEAERAIDHAMALDPDLVETRIARARGLIAEGRFEEAKNVLQALVRSRPRLDVAWANLGRAHQALGDYPQALDALNRAIKLRPDSFRHRIYLGNLYQQFREHDEAAAAFREAIKRKPQSPIAWQNLGASLLHMGRADEAIEALDRSLAISERAQTLTNLGTAYYSLGRYDEAVRHYTRATQLAPEFAVVWGNLGDGLRMTGNLDAARDAYTRAADRAAETVETAPSDPKARIRLALWLARAGELDRATDEGNVAARMSPRDTQILFTNAVIRCVAGRPEDALGWLERAVQSGLGRTEIENEPDFRVLHDDPRYRSLLELAS